MHSACKLVDCCRTPPLSRGRRAKRGGDRKRAKRACDRRLQRLVRRYPRLRSHSASSTVMPSGPERKTSFRPWKSMTSFRSRTPATSSFATSVARSSTAKQTWLNPSFVRLKMAGSGTGAGWRDVSTCTAYRRCGGALASGEEDQFSAVEVHDLVPKSNARDLELCHFGRQIVHGEADMVEPELREVENGRIRQGIRMAVLQQLYLGPRCYVGE